MKKTLFVMLCSILCYCSAQAQEDHKFQLAIESGVIMGSNFGLLFQVEPKYRISKKETFGLRIGGQGVLGRNITLYDELFQDLNGLGYRALSIIATLDQSFADKENRFQPFIGGGAGFFKGTKENNIIVNNSTDFSIMDATVKAQIAFLIRGGFELGRFRLGLEYNFLPPVQLILTDETVIGKINHSYFAATLGFVFGGE